MKINHFILFLFLFCPCISSAEEIPQVTSGEVKESISSIDNDKMVWKLVPRNVKPEEESNNNLKGDIGAIGEVIKILAIVFIAFFVLILLYLIFKDVKFQNNKQKAIAIELDNIQDITVVNFDLLLKEALEKKDYRLAIRIKFLTMLQQMQVKQKIVWKPNKTNRAYSTELAESYLGKPFKSLSSIFEQIWYGHADINEDQYESISLQFESMKKLI